MPTPTWTDYMWNPTPGASERELSKPLGRRAPYFARFIIGFDLFDPTVSDGHIMKVWNLCAQVDFHGRNVLIRTSHDARLQAWFFMWLDVDERDAGDFKDARGPAAVRAAHKGGRAELFARMLDEIGEPPPGCAFPLYDWMQGPLYWPDRLPAVTIELNGKPWKPARETAGAA